MERDLYITIQEMLLRYKRKIVLQCLKRLHYNVKIERTIENGGEHETRKIRKPSWLYSA